MSEAYERIISALKDKDVKYGIIEHEPVLGMEGFNDSLPFSREQLVKTMVFRVKSSHWVLVAAKGDSKLDFGKLAKKLNISRNTLEKPGIDEVQSELGFQPGGVGPFALNDDTVIVWDSAIGDLDIMYCGVGRNDRTLEITPSELRKATHPEMGDITR